MLKKFFNMFNKRAKYDAELNFWRQEIYNYTRWYSGEIKEHYGTVSPEMHETIDVGILSHSAILTWTACHQQKKYLHDLMLTEDAFNGMKILDVGSGPMPSATIFRHAEIYCLDPHIPEYIRLGFPLHYSNAKFMYGKSEEIPCKNNFFDAVISVNALDHVDDFSKTAKEIARVLKPEGQVRLHLHYHKRALTEPIELNDQIVMSHFAFCQIKKIIEKNSKMGHALQNNTEKYTLWSNF
jgi:ubiquinone/menaquinone biosynthesis C-methylase UbiE